MVKYEVSLSLDEKEAAHKHEMDRAKSDINHLLGLCKSIQKGKVSYFYLLDMVTQEERFKESEKQLWSKVSISVVFIKL